MKDSIKNAIDLIYRKGDQSFYSERCSLDLSLPPEILSFLNRNNILFFDESPNEIWPSRTWRVDFGRYLKGEFDASFQSYLSISKLADVFYIQHEFEVRNKVEERIDPTLTSFAGTPYIMKQYDFHTSVFESLSSTGYAELIIAELEEAIPDLAFPEDVTIFGPQVTVRYALFQDILELCPLDDNDV